MIYDLQRGSLLKRASAFLLDAILLVILATGFSFALSALFHYNSYNDTYSDSIERYAEEYGVDFTAVVSQDDYDSLSETERQRYDDVVYAMNNDQELIGVLGMIVRIIVTMVSLSIFLAFMIVEFVLPLVFGNGQTIGKKIFGIAVMRKNGTRINAVTLFIRTFLGKYVIETMIPVLTVMMMIFSGMGIMAGTGIFGLLLVFLLLIAQIALIALTKTKSMLHDIVSDCVVVDMASQMIFDDEQSMIEYKARKAAEEAASAPY